MEGTADPFAARGDIVAGHFDGKTGSWPFLIGIIGSPATTRSERNLIEGLAREHSRKPEEAYAFCERWYPGARRVELFSRTGRPGWDSWGNEAGKLGSAT